MKSFDLDKVEAVFTYGILQPGQGGYRRIEDHVKGFIEKSYIQGWDMYAKDFPFISPSNNKDKVVWGTLLLFDNNVIETVLRRMDRIEASVGYSRIKEDVHIEGNNKLINAWVYAQSSSNKKILKDEYGFSLVDHGNFIKYQEDTSKKYM